MSLLLATLLLATPPADTARTVSGVSMPETIEVNGHTLHLNGMALRKKFIVSVYVAGLYVTTPSTKEEELFSADAPRRMVMVFKRGVDKKKICNGWDEGLEKNTPGADAELKAQFGQLCEAMRDIEDKQTMLYTYIPGEGTHVEVNGETTATIPGKAFADALLGCWIGPDPGPGKGFKKKLLGQES